MPSPTPSSGRPRNFPKRSTPRIGQIAPSPGRRSDAPSWRTSVSFSMLATGPRPLIDEDVADDHRLSSSIASSRMSRSRSTAASLRWITSVRSSRRLVKRDHSLEPAVLPRALAARVAAHPFPELARAACARDRARSVDASRRRMSNTLAEVALHRSTPLSSAARSSSSRATVPEHVRFQASARSKRSSAMSGGSRSFTCCVLRSRSRTFRPDGFDF